MGAARSPYHTFIHENVRKRFLEGFHYDAHPMGMLVSAVAALSTFYLDAKDIFDPESRDKQIIRLIAKMPTLAAAAHRFSVGMPFVYPDNSLAFTSNFLSMMWKIAEPRFEADPVLARALDVLFILHADHEQNCSTTAMRVVGSSHADPYSATAAAAAALYGPRHGGANEAVIRMLTEIGSHRQRRALHRLGQVGLGRPAPGLRPPGLQELRPPGHDHQADGRRGVLHHRQEPAPRHRPQARGDRPLRRLLHLPQALPQRRLLLRASSTRPWASRSRCSPCCSPSPARPGWLAHWQEMLDQDSKIARPRQLYIGAEARDYVPIGDR